MADDKFNKLLPGTSQEDRTTPKAIAYDVLSSLILLGGAWVIEQIKTLFPPPGPPAILLIILNISELTLLGYFIVALLRAVISIFREVDVLISLSKEGQTIKSIVKSVKAVTDRRIKAEETSFSYKLLWLSISFYLTLIYSGFLLLIFWLSGLSVNWGSWRIGLITVSGIVFLLFVFWFNQRLSIRLLGAYEASGLSIGVTHLQKGYK